MTDSTLHATQPVSDAVRDLAAQHGVVIEAAVARLGGRLDVWERSARSVLPQLESFGQSFEQSVAAAAPLDAARVLHTVKGVAGTLGLKPLADWAVASEVAVKAAAGAVFHANDALAPGGWVPQLRAQLLRAQESLVAILGQCERDAALLPRPTQARDPAALRAALEALHGPLRDGDMVATDTFADLLVAHEAHWALELLPLSDAIAALDFESAAKACGDLIAALPSE